MPHSAASDLGLHFLHVSHKKDGSLKWVNTMINSHIYCLVKSVDHNQLPS